MKSELNWEDGGREAEAAVAESGGDFDGRARSAEICTRGQECGQSGSRVSEELSSFESGGGQVDAVGGCGRGDGDSEGKRGEYVPPPAIERLDGTNSQDSHNEDASDGAIAASLADRDGYSAPANFHFVSESREATLQREFAHHEPGVARINNGSFGSAPKCVLDDQAEWKAQWLRHPDAFCWDPLTDGFLAARKGLAELIGYPDVDEVVLLENATSGAAIVALDCMWGFLEGRFQQGDAILMFDSAYGAVKKCFQAYCVRAGAHLLEYKMPFPVASNSEIIRTFEEFLQKKKAEYPSRTIRLVILDHITSMPSIILPVRDLVCLCRNYGVEKVFVDGAHAIGSVDVDVNGINADYYMANVHKWLFAPPVVAFFHAKPQLLSRLHHPVVSHSYGAGLLTETYWVGTRDYSALLAVPKAIQFMKDLFGDLKAYEKSNHDMAVEMGVMLARTWGTSLGAPPEMFASMVMVGLPAQINIHSHDDALRMRSRLRDEFHVEVPLFYAGESVSYMNSSKHLAYARISHQVYNKLEDYYAFRDAVNSIVDECTLSVGLRDRKSVV